MLKTSWAPKKVVSSNFDFNIIKEAVKSEEKTWNKFYPISIIEFSYNNNNQTRTNESK